MTVFTPETDAACRPAASRCDAFSTDPDRVTTPSLACTVNCLSASPESWLNLFWMSLDIFASSSLFMQPTLSNRMDAKANEDTDRDFLFILDSCI